MYIYIFSIKWLFQNQNPVVLMNLEKKSLNMIIKTRKVEGTKFNLHATLLVRDRKKVYIAFAFSIYAIVWPWLWSFQCNYRIVASWSTCYFSELLFRKSEIWLFKVSITNMQHIFFRNKTFLFFKIESWNFQHLIDLGFRESSQNFSSYSDHFYFLEPMLLIEFKY